VKYRTIVADPPWPYPSPGQFHRSLSLLGTTSSVLRYGAMSLPEICASMPPAGDAAHLYLWTTNAFMCEAHDVARAWGFAPKTILTWVKMQDNGTPSMKTGYYFRGATEHVVFAVRGSQRLLTADGLPTAFLWPRLPHSVKPDAFYDLVESASPGPYLELFARRQRLGWDTWGNECFNHTDMAVTE